MFAGLCALGALSVVPHLLMMRSGLFQQAFEEARTEAVENGSEFSAPPELFSQMETFLTVFLVVWIVFALLGAFLSILSGSYLRGRRKRTFSQVVAALQCLAVPLGTVLGIFTFVVLGRPTVQQTYDQVPR